ncbi:MAG: histidinol-phosphatase HisJ family protein [Eubacteriales bacterium]|nr:histidinol-phosphatase HisJ family protein [Eubacteriales bacterium]
MNYLYDFHMHTKHSDGVATVAEMCAESYRRGMKRIGFTDHAYEIRPDGTEPFGIKGAELDAYIDDVYEQKEIYRGKMEILCGFELENQSGFDYITKAQAKKFDYTIGSTHSMIKNGEGFELDYGEDRFTRLVRDHFDGDYLKLARDYYEYESHVVERTHCQIIGHFDLITKYNQGKKLYDDDAPEYKEAALSCMEKLLKEDVLFEINTGAMARGNRKEPYPSRFLLEELCKRGGRITLNSDSHSTENICFAFEDALKLAWECGFRQIYTVKKDGFEELNIADI